MEDQNQNFVAAVQRYVTTSRRLQALDERRNKLLGELRNADHSFADFYARGLIEPYGEKLVQIGGIYYLVRFSDFEDKDLIKDIYPLDVIVSKLGTEGDDD